EIDHVILAFSCANGFFAVATAKRVPNRIRHMILSQMPSTEAMRRWADKNIPKPLRWALLGQLLMAFNERRFAKTWYKYSLMRETAREPFEGVALDALSG